MYRAFDQDESGTLSYTEFLVGLYLIQNDDEKSQHEFARNMINDFDLNHDGSIDENEFIDGVLKNEKYKQIMPK